MKYRPKPNPPANTNPGPVFPNGMPMSNPNASPGRAAMITRSMNSVVAR